jgi:hypothetical protein
LGSKNEVSGDVRKIIKKFKIDPPPTPPHLALPLEKNERLIY